MDNCMEKLLMIFKERFNKDLSGQWTDIQDEHLLGSNLRMDASDLIYLFFDIEEEFGITIPEEYIAIGKFSSLRSIVQMILLEQEASGTSLDTQKVS